MVFLQEELDSSFETKEDLSKDYDPSDPSNSSSSDDDDISEPFYCSVNYRRVILYAERKNLSLREVAALINLCHLDSGTTDKTKMISPSGVRKQKIKLGLEVLEEHKAKKGFKTLKFDGKSHDSLLPNNLSESVHTITAISEPEYQLVDLFDTESEGAEDIANGVFKVITNTSSQDSLLALGSGK